MNKKIIKSERTIYFLLAAISIVISASIFFTYINKIPKYEFIKSKEFNEGARFKVISYYEDLDSDGISERIPIGYSDSQKNYFLQIFKLNDNFLEQFNFHSKRIYHFNVYHNSWMTFEDWDNDGYKEIFCPSVDKDTLFLNIISTKELDFTLINRPIYIRRNIKKELPWSIERIIGKTIDINGDGHKDLLLSFMNGYSLQPRGFMTYDIKHNAIIDTFFTEVCTTDFTITDIDKDGRKDIICVAGGGGQYPDSATFTDQKKWLFVFNKDLSFKIPPRSYGKMGTAVDIVLVNSEIRLLAIGINNNLDALYERISNKGELLENKIIKNFGIGTLKSFNNDNGEHFFVVSIKNKFTKLFSAELKEIAQNDKYMNFSFASDLTGDGEKELLFRDGTNYIVTNQRLEKLAEFKLKDISVGPELISFGKGKRKGVAIQTANKNVIYFLQDSPVNKYAIPITFSIFLIIYVILILNHELLKQISIFYKTFLFFIQHDDSSLLLLDSKGKVLRYNKQFERLFLQKDNHKGKYFDKLLKSYTNIYETINEGIKGQHKIRKELSFYKKEKSFKGKIEVIPFRAFLGFTFAYLIRIVDQTEEIFSERNQVWSHTAQKIAHELKTPLNSIQLNLNALKKRLEKLNLTNSDVTDDVETINNEINRIKTLTSSLLKITNLEKSNVNIYSLKVLVEAALQKFKGYFNNGIKIFVSPEIERKFILFDKNQFIEMLQILIENSIDALHGEGQINIYHEEENNRELNLIIEDNGEGIEAKNRERIFDPYFTTKREGTGLGLAFAKKIINDNNGKIEILSEEGKGTVVKISLRKKNEV